MRGVAALTACLAFAVPAAAQHPYEPDKVQLALDELCVKYPPDEVRYRRFYPEESDDEPPDHPATHDEAQVYGGWLSMLARRATRAAADRPERNWAGHARDELAIGLRWLERGAQEEGLRGNAPPRENPVSIARRIDERRIDRRAKATSCYTEALRAFHRGSRYAMAVLKARGLDPTREPVAEERTPH